MSRPDLASIDMTSLAGRELGALAREWGAYWIVEQSQTPTVQEVNKAISNAFRSAGRPLEAWQSFRFARYAIEYLADAGCAVPRDLEHMRSGMVQRQHRLAVKGAKSAEAMMPSPREILAKSTELSDLRELVKGASDLAKVSTGADALIAKLLHLDKFPPEQSLTSYEAREEVLDLLGRALAEFDDKQRDRLGQMVAESRVSDQPLDEDLVDSLDIV